jgi:hypothetical protein
VLYLFNHSYSYDAGALRFCFRTGKGPATRVDRDACRFMKQWIREISTANDVRAIDGAQIYKSFLLFSLFMCAEPFISRVPRFFTSLSSASNLFIKALIILESLVESVSRRGSRCEEWMRIMYQIQLSILRLALPTT